MLRFIGLMLFFLLDLYRMAVKSQLVLLASSLAYMTTLAFLPLTAFCFYIYKMFGGLDNILFDIKPLIFQYLAPNIGEQVYNYLSRSLVNINFEALGLMGLSIFLLSGIHLLGSIEKAVNRIWRVENNRHFIVRWFSYFIVLVLAPFAVAILFSAATISGYLPVFRNIVGVFLFLVILLMLIYKSLPNCRVTISASLLASIFSTLVLLSIKQGYAYYLRKALAYNTLYGSLSILPIMLLWIYLIWFVILFGVIVSEVANRYLFKH